MNVASEEKRSKHKHELCVEIVITGVNMYIFYRLNNDKERVGGFRSIFFSVLMCICILYIISLQLNQSFQHSRKISGKGETIDTSPHLLFTRRHYFLKRKRILSPPSGKLDRAYYYGQRNTSIEDFFIHAPLLRHVPPHPSLLRKGRIAW